MKYIAIFDLPAGLRGRVIFGKGNSMKFPTYEEMAQNVAEKALDEYEYKGKTLRQWVEIISAIPVTAIPATDNNVATKDGTNLASLGTNCSEFPNNSDTISREAVADAINGIECTRNTTWYEFYQKVITAVGKLPPAEPKRGKWIDGIIPNDRGGLPVIVCDQCNTFFPLQFGDSHNFCPNCGAKMEVTT